jgi:hypothetical protein
MADIELNKYSIGAFVSSDEEMEDKTDDWPLNCVTEARKDTPVVTEAVSGILTNLLRGLLSERALTPGELTTLTNYLIGELIPIQPPPKTDTAMPE